MTLLDKMLLLSLENLIIPREVLISLCSSDRQSQSVLKDAQDRGYLGEKVFKSKTLTVRCCYLTTEGFRYLISRHVTPWLSYIDPEQTKKASAYGKYNHSQEQLRRLAPISETSIMSYAAGAVTAFPIHKAYAASKGERILSGDLTSHTSTGKTVQVDKTYTSLMIHAMEAYGHDCVGQKILDMNDKTPDLPEDIIRFTPITRVKDLTVSKGETQKDFDRCRFTGILDSRFNCFLLYSAHGDGMSWSTWTSKKETQLLQRWGKSFSVTSSDSHIFYGGRDLTVFGGVLFVKNSRQFANLYLDCAGKRKRGTYLGEGLHSLCIVPKTYLGTKYLRWLMLSNSGAVRGIVVEYMVKQGYDHCPGDFPLVRDNLRIYVGVRFDAIMLKRFETYARKDLRYKYGIVCLEWQKDYYERVLKDVAVEYITLPNNFF